MQISTLPKHDVVLLGVGHTNSHVLRMWRMSPPRDARLTCISNFPVVTYSGMLPGVLSGQYAKEQMEIDLVRLCAAAGARLIVGKVIGLDREHRRILFEDRVPIPYDLLSIGVGSTPSFDKVSVQGDAVVPIKPMQTFLERLEQRLDVVRSHGASPIRVVVVGAGAGGVEIAFCLERRLRMWLQQAPFKITVVHGLAELIGGVRPKTSRRAQRELESRGVQIVLGRRVTQVVDGKLTLDNGDELTADIVLWSTSAVASPLLPKLGLAADDKGFLLTRPTLQTEGDEAIFAVGDSGTIVSSSTPKAGVFAVRQGPVLWDNIGRWLHGDHLMQYQPQSDFLKLFNLGDGRALGEYKGWTFAGRWAWKLKDSIDRKFMEMYQDYEPMTDSSNVESKPIPIRCTGCGGKVGGSVLSRVLSRLDVPPSNYVLLGLEAPDDSAIIQLPPGKALNATVDFFAAPLDDPFIVGRLAALNSASDCFATGARPIAALAAVTIPIGPAPQQEQLLYELLGGALHEFRTMGATLVGGHTIEGPQLTIGFTMLAEQVDPPRTKRKLRAGDQLLLTKPIGTGVLLAALMRARCHASWFETLLNSMLLSNQHAASFCEEYDIQGVTDITGFGLAGHLMEMLRSSEMGAVVHLSRISLLPGTAELLRSGLESTLAPANREIESEIEVSEALRRQQTYPALFDPQTSGGLLLGVPKQHLEPLLTRLREHSQVQAAHIGEVVPWSGTGPRLRCVE
jgi:selenide,water dikinase